MKQLLKLTSLLMLLTMSFGFTSCSDDDDKKNGKNAIVGTWRCDWDEGGWIGYEILTIGADGTWNWEMFETSPEGESYHDGATGTYTWRDNMVTIYEKNDSESDTAPLFVKDGKLYFDGELYYRVK